MIKKDRIIPATYDFIFKKLLSEEDSKPYLAKMISLIIEIDYKEILKNIRIGNTELMSIYKGDKNSIADIVVYIKESKLINLEMNKNYYKGLIDKNYNYINKLGSTLYKKGESYNSEKQIIQINFDNYHFFEKRKLINKCMITEVETGEIENRNMIIYHINLAYLKEICYSKDIKKLDELEKYCLMLIEESFNKVKKISKGDEVMEKMVEKISEVQELTFKAAIYDRKEEEEKIRECYKATGLEEGLKEGLKEGLEQGLEQGKKDIQTKIILKMNEQGFSAKEISDMTGIDQKIIKDINKK